MSCRTANRGFTLVEMMVGMSLAIIVMGGVLSSYIFLGRSLTRLGNQQSLEAQSRQLQQYFAQDVRMASTVHYSGDGVSGDSANSDPTSSNLTLHLPTSTGSTWVNYAYDSSARTLTRTTAGGTGRVILRNLTAFSFTYYSATATITPPGNTVSLASIAGISLTYSAQLGDSFSGTRTRVYDYNTPKLMMYNKTWSP